MTRKPATAAVAPPKPGRPSRPTHRTRPRLSPDLVAELAARLTPRDRWLLRMLHEHRVLTSVQIAQLAFGAPTTAAHRLLDLWTLRAVDRVQPFARVGAAPMHYVLGDAGAVVLAAEDGVTVPELGYRRDRALSIFHSTRLAHTVGINSVMAALVAHARSHPASRLAEWWPEHRCAKIWGDLARPDAFGRWRDGAAEVDFFLEYDTGSETIARVARKLNDYADLADATGITTPVLFWFPTSHREADVLDALRTPVPVATAAADHDDADPAGRRWLPIGLQASRLPLAELASLSRVDRVPHRPGDPSPPVGQAHQPAPGAPVAPMPPSASPEE